MKPTEDELQSMIGQFESMRLEFKSSRLLAENKQNITEVLTNDVSAFANSEDE